MSFKIIMGLFDFLSKQKVSGIINFLKLENWHNSLTPEQQKKLKEYSGEGEDLIKGEISYSSRTQKHFLWVTATNAIYHKDYEFAIYLVEEGLTAQGSLVDQHFIYHAFIEAYQKQSDYENAKKYCLAELEDFSKGPKGRVPRAMPVGECIGGDMVCLGHGSPSIWPRSLSNRVSRCLDSEISPPYPESWGAGLFEKTFPESDEEFAWV